MNGGRKGVGNGLESGVLWLPPTVTCDVILVQACQMQASVLIMCDDHTVIGWLGSSGRKAGSTAQLRAASAVCYNTAFVTPTVLAYHILQVCFCLGAGINSKP